MSLLATLALLVVPAGSADPAFDSEESSFLTLLNNYRADEGLPPLIAHVDLNEAADWYATDMATKNYYGDYTYCNANFGIQSAHCDSLGRLPGARAKAFGYPQSVGENSAAGFMTAQSVFDAWKGSAGHNANMLGGYLVIGIGRACNAAARYGCYWVTDFGFVNSPTGTNPAASGSLTPTATLGPTPSPTPSPAATPTPSPLPTPRGLTWEDLNCDTRVIVQDAVTLLALDAGIENAHDVAAADCPSLGEYVSIEGVWRAWGDIDCSGAINAIDTIKLMRWLLGLPIEVVDPSCPTPGTAF